MIWDDEISFAGLKKKVDAWRRESWLTDTPIDAQYALNLLFKTLIDDKEHYPYLTTLPENQEQINSIMLNELLWRYSRKYRRFWRKETRQNERRKRMCLDERRR